MKINWLFIGLIIFALFIGAIYWDAYDDLTRNVKYDSSGRRL